MMCVKYFARVTFLFSILFFAGNVIAQYDQQKTFIFLQEIYDRHDKNLYDLLITELNNYLQTFPTGEHSAEALDRLGKVYEEKGAIHEALATYMKILYLYPESAYKSQWADLVRRVVAYEGNNEKSNTGLLDVTEQKADDRPIQDRYFDYLRILKRLDQPKFDAWLLSSCNEFIQWFPNDGRNDRVLLWIAETYDKRGDLLEAEVSYQKLDRLYPQSQLLPQALLRRGELLCCKLKEYDKAIAIFNRIVSDFPETEFAGEALFMLGTLYEKKKKDYKLAIKSYRRLVDKYPKNKHGISALFSIANIYKNKLKNYSAAIFTFNEIVKKDTAGINGTKALEKIASIYNQSLKDFGKAAETYKRIADIYINYEKAPEKLFKAGTICEQKLKDNEKALSYYQIIIDKYPTHKKAVDTKKRIEKLQQRMWADKNNERKGA